MKKINLCVVLISLSFVICAGDVFAQTDQQMKIEDKNINRDGLSNPKKMAAKLTRKMRDAFFAYFGREPNSKEAEYWHSVEIKNNYPSSQFVSLIKERFTAPKNYTEQAKKAHLEEIRGIIERAYKTAKKPAPTSAELDKWGINIAFGKDWYRTILDSLESK